MPEDAITTAARGLTRDEARVLTRYANNETAADIAITLEMHRPAVVSIIRSKGNDNRGYARNVVARWSQLQKPADTPRPVPAPAYAAARVAAPVAAGVRDVPDDEDFIGTVLPANALGSAPATPKKAPPGAAKDRKIVNISTVPAAPRQAAKPAAERVADPEPEPQSEPAAAAEPTPADEPEQILASPQPEPEPQPEPQPEPEPVPVPVVDVSTADLTALMPQALRDPMQRLLGRALESSYPGVAAAAQKVRAALAEMLTLSAKEREVQILQERIELLDAQIAEKESTRSELRRQLDELIAAGLVVSASSTPVRASTPDEEAKARAWGKANGYQVADRGRVPGGVIAAYRKHVAEGNS